MKIYVAAPFNRHPRARAFADALVQQGHEITWPWWREADNYPDGVSPFEAGQEHALQDLYGVYAADFVVVLTSEHKHEGCGMYVEAGAAMALGKPFMFVGPLRDRTIFARLGLRVDTDERALAALKRLSLEGFAESLQHGGLLDPFAAYCRLRSYRRDGVIHALVKAEARLKHELAALDKLQKTCEAI